MSEPINQPPIPPMKESIPQFARMGQSVDDVNGDMAAVRQGRRKPPANPTPPPPANDNADGADAWGGTVQTEHEKMLRQKIAKANTCHDAADWLAEPDEPDQPVIHGLIESGEMFALVGQSKAGKSLVALQMAVCVAAGRDFLGRKTERKRVYVANLEVSARQYKKRMRSLCKSLGIAAEELRGWLFVDNMKGETASWDYVLEVSKMKAAGLAMIDPFYQIFHGAETDETACINAVDEMKKFSTAGITLGVAFHSPKGFCGDRQLIDMISGSSVLARFPESIVGILNHATEKDARVVDCELRNYAKPDPFSIKFSDGAFVPAYDLAAAVKSSGMGRRFKTPKEKEKERAAATDKKQSDLRNALTLLLTKAGNDLLSKTQLHERLEKSTHMGEHTVRGFVKARIDDGELKEADEIYKDGDERGKPKPRKSGGKVFISTPERIDAYLKSFEELPFDN